MFGGMLRLNTQGRSHRKAVQFLIMVSEMINQSESGCFYVFLVEYWHYETPDSLLCAMRKNSDHKMSVSNEIFSFIHSQWNKTIVENT